MVRFELVTVVRADPRAVFEESLSVEAHQASMAGPFRTWRHEHRFESDGAGGTVMRDTVEFAAPLGILGGLAERAVLGRHLKRLIARRNAHLKAALEVS